MKFLALDEVDVSATTLARRYEMSVLGTAIDERGCKSEQLCAASAARQVRASYDPSTFTLRVGDRLFRADELAALSAVHGDGSVLLDATTLEVPELLLLCRAFLRGGREVGFVYLEPKGYARARDRSPSDVHTFDLSEEIRKLDPIPGFTPELPGARRAHLLAFLGFEPNRLDQVLDPDEAPAYGYVSVAFGVPPFQPGWEMHALMRIAASLGKQSDCDIRYCAASNARSAYRVICDAYNGLRGELEEDARLVLAPLGTKPASVAVALFAAGNSEVRVLFDFPKRRANRTEGVARVHHIVVKGT